MNIRPLIIATACSAAIGAAPAAAADCRADISRAESLHAIPTGLMDAVGYVESGYDPLSINADGTPYHPRSIDEAVRLVERLQRNGARYIDVGCMQIDLRYHPTAFATLRAAFDPVENTTYGARYLKDNWSRFGSWTQAVAFYHSADPQKQAEYVTRVKARLTGGALPATRHVSAIPMTAPKMVTVRLSMMTVRRPLAGTGDTGGQ